jgi:CubicO group peptidase (beta-lactamase class C family)
MPEFRGVATVTRDGLVVRTVAGGGLTVSTRFPVASVSKNVCATVALRLARRGVLDLHAPLSGALPEAPPAWRDITLHHLLSHSSGLGHWDDVPGLDPLAATPVAAAEQLALVLGAPLLCAPGAEFHYSSPGYIVVAELIERATSRPYGEVLADEVLRPAGLTRTVSGSRPADIAPPHSAGRPVTDWRLTTAVGTGDLTSTVDDLTAYARAYRPDLRAHVALPAPEHVLDGRLELTGYGYGSWIGTFDGEPAATCPGDVPGYKSLIAWLPFGRGVVALSADDATDWDEVLRPLL